jgi:hypothetical protein
VPADAPRGSRVSAQRPLRRLSRHRRGEVTDI